MTDIVLLLVDISVKTSAELHVIVWFECPLVAEMLPGHRFACEHLTVIVVLHQYQTSSSGCIQTTDRTLDILRSGSITSTLT